MVLFDLNIVSIAWQLQLTARGLSFPSGIGSWLNVLAAGGLGSTLRTALGINVTAVRHLDVFVHATPTNLSL